MSLRKAIIIAVHPERRRVDLIYTDNSERAAEVEVMTPDASSDGGSWNVPSVPKPASESAAGRLNQGGRNLVATVGMCMGRPIVLGFTPPSGGLVAFSQQNRSIQRHPSGSYTTISPDGSVEVFHASGAYLRIGTGQHEDLTPVVAGSAWPAAAGSADITIATSGFTLSALAGGTVTINANVSVQVTAPKIKMVGTTSVEITAPAITLNGPTTINGSLSQGQGAAGGAATMLGPVLVTNDVKAGTISLIGHHHVNPPAGSAV